MTMADTVAVMNEGRIEQMGRPEELYDLPVTPSSRTSSARPTSFPVSSPGSDGSWHVVTAAGRSFPAAAARTHTTEGPWLSACPEKVRDDRDRARRRGGLTSVIGPGTVLDVCFTGVSTQYLVKVPGLGTWGSSSRTSTSSASTPARETQRGWPGTPDTPSSSPAGRPCTPGSRRSTRTLRERHGPRRCGARRWRRWNGQARGWTPYLLLLPGLLWLVIFFIVPTVQLFTVSQSQFPDYPGYYYRDVNVGTYATAPATSSRTSVDPPAVCRAGDDLRVHPRLPARVRHGVQGRQVAQRHDDLRHRPFFTSFILRTIAWRQILADEGPVVSTLKLLRTCRRTGGSPRPPSPSSRV